ncbi:hypothetical protein [Haloglomus litoreum]|uniref:hypothetical protein n=1 Tax=Haloglomus litoreum TaxID=3034026 RepID=UPI0023E8A606|nr:hypothetical protein [Haloglomus sp. DT116]
MATGSHEATDQAVLATFFPNDSAFRALTEPRTLPESWRAARFDQADRRATEHVGYAVLMVRGRLNGELGNRHVIRVLYVTGDRSATTYRDYECQEDSGYRPRADRWRCTLALSMGFDADPIAGVEREVLDRLLDTQYPDRGGA